MSYLCRTIACFPPLEAFWALSDTRNLVFSGEAIKSVLTQEPLDSVSKVHGVFSNEILFSTSEGQPRIIAIADNVLGVSSQQRIGRICLFPGFYFP